MTVRPADVAGVVLAAGAGRRFGGPKALVELDGVRLVDRAVATLLAGGCAPVVVVAGAVPLVVEGATVLCNPDWKSGMGSSLRTALAHLAGAPASGVVVGLVDTPWIGAEAVRLLIAAHQAGSIAAQAMYGGEPGHPVLLDRSVWDEVAVSSTGDRGARRWLAGNADRVTLVPCDGTGDPRDVDRPEDLQHRPR